MFVISESEFSLLMFIFKDALTPLCEQLVKIIIFISFIDFLCVYSLQNRKTCTCCESVELRKLEKLNHSYS